MASQIAHWFSPYEQFFAIGVGAAAIVAVAAIASRMVRSAAGQAVVWRIATISMFLLLAFELTGFGQAAAQLADNGLPDMRKAEKERQFPSDYQTELRRCSLSLIRRAPFS